MATKNFDGAKRNKADEFYTQLSDIEKEMRFYREQFRGKVVFCNCDDPFESNFFKYFAINFKFLELKQLIATCYIGSPIANKELSLLPHESVENKTTKAPHKIVINEAVDENNDGAFDLPDIILSLTKNKNNTLTRLNDDGDFLSAECIELLKQADIVATNPPFSLFHEFIDLIIKHKKHFIIIGNQNAITYKDIFALIKANKLWLGLSMNGSNRWFRVPNDYAFSENAKHKVDEQGYHYIFVNNVVWYTNMDTPKRHERITFYKKYSKTEHKHFDNYNAINVDKVTDIPTDYFGDIGVPISFMHKYNPEQFEIVDALNRYALLDTQNTNEAVRNAKSHTCNINGIATYFRIVVRKKENT
ncbi:MAG: adenine-specific methyltransferase EcoRI family protein [Christensenellaceae bacterium]|jgi:hypothetical protein|nr:adenine-specific methyltransferase EcoRI family protein [Christensenellaceae bacterium]